jgi:hypothetical protein
MTILMILMDADTGVDLANLQTPVQRPEIKRVNQSDSRF